VGGLGAALTKADEYRARCASTDWEPLPAARSGLPGPRANLELAQDPDWVAARLA
jgi:hypothetical protein